MQLHYGSVSPPCQAGLFIQGNRELLVPFFLVVVTVGKNAGQACSIRNFDLLDDNKERSFLEKRNTLVERQLEN
jgi:hypothetical protein